MSFLLQNSILNVKTEYLHLFFKFSHIYFTLQPLTFNQPQGRKFNYIKCQRKTHWHSLELLDVEGTNIHFSEL